MEFTKFEKVSLKSHPELDERWVQRQIADDPSILGLGDLELIGKEKKQPHAGILDLLLQESDSYWRYEVEVQLGATDPSHIIRTLEYWDIERRRYPQYEHTAVIIAEDITSRFLNVVSLFNGVIPLMAIQMNALRNGDQVGLVFTKVLDEMSLGFADEGEEVTDRKYWENQGSKETVAMADELLNLARQCDDSLKSIELNYNKFYIGITKDNRSKRFFTVKPKKKFIRLTAKLKESSGMTGRLENTGLDFDYHNRSGRYRIRLKPGEIEKSKEILAEMIRGAYRENGE